MSGDLYTFFIHPFVEYTFMMRALVCSFLFCVCSVPFGLLLQLRHISFLGEALSHGILPGFVMSYFFFGFSIPFLLIGGIGSGLLLLFLSRFLTTLHVKNEDSVLSTLYLIFLSLGVFLISTQLKGICNLTHLLFGNILAIDENSFYWSLAISLLSLLTFILFYRPFVYESLDHQFMKQRTIKSFWFLFLMMIAATLILSCQTMGTLMSLAMMMIPSSCGRLLGKSLLQMILGAIFVGMISSYGGLVMSYAYNLPSGPSMVLVSGAFYLSLSLFKVVSRLMNSQPFFKKDSFSLRN